MHRECLRLQTDVCKYETDCCTFTKGLLQVKVWMLFPWSKNCFMLQMTHKNEKKVNVLKKRKKKSDTLKRKVEILSQWNNRVFEAYATSLPSFDLSRPLIDVTEKEFCLFGCFQPDDKFGFILRIFRLLVLFW